MAREPMTAHAPLPRRAPRPRRTRHAEGRFAQDPQGSPPIRRPHASDSSPRVHRPTGRWLVALATVPVLYVPVAILFGVWDGDWRTVAPVLALLAELPIWILVVTVHAADHGRQAVLRRGLFVLVVGVLARALFVSGFVLMQVQT